MHTLARSHEERKQRSTNSHVWGWFRYTTSYTPRAATVTFTLPAAVAVTVRLSHDYPKVGLLWTLCRLEQVLLLTHVVLLLGAAWLQWLTQPSASIYITRLDGIGHWKDSELATIRVRMRALLLQCYPCHHILIHPYTPQTTEGVQCQVLFLSCSAG